MESLSLTFIVAPSFREGIIIRIHKRKWESEKPYFLIYQKSLVRGMSLSRPFHEKNEVSESWERVISAHEADKIFSLLNDLKVTVKPAHVFGLDGTNYVLIVENGFNKVEYKWWSRVPKGWEKLGEIAGVMLSLAGEREISL